jgi:CelD/BcsL family acetyltransferase involved in cellulose biosynthesis
VPVERHADVAAVAEEWDALALRTRARPWHRPGWFTAWYGAFGHDTPEVVAVRRDGRLAAVAPLVRNGGRLEAAANWHSPDFALVAEDDSARRELADAIVSSAGQRLHLMVLADDGGIGELRKAASAAGARVLTHPQLHSPYVPVEGTHDEYVAAHPGKKRRKELARSRTRLAEQGELSVDVRDGRTDLDAVLAEGFAIEGSGWKLEQGTAIVSQPDTRAFYTDLARWAADEGILRLFFLRAGERAVAFELALDDGRSLYDVKGGYDVEFRKCSPGYLIQEALIAYAFEHGRETFEMLGDEEPFKLEFTEHTRERVSFDVFSRSPRGIGDYLVHAYARPAVKRVLAARRG